MSRNAKTLSLSKSYWHNPLINLLIRQVGGAFGIGTLKEGISPLIILQKIQAAEDIVLGAV